MTYATTVTVTCDVCRERTTSFESTFLNKSITKMRLRSRGWKFSKGKVPYTGADRQTYYYDDAERNVCPSCFSNGRHK